MATWSDQAEILRMIGTSFRKIGREIGKSHTTVEAIVKGRRPKIWSADTERKVWAIIERERSLAVSKLKNLKPITKPQ